MKVHNMAVGAGVVLVEYDMKYHPLFCVCKINFSLVSPIDIC
jgi:hypothetical protein